MASKGPKPETPAHAVKSVAKPVTAAVAEKAAPIKAATPVAPKPVAKPAPVVAKAVPVAAPAVPKSVVPASASVSTHEAIQPVAAPAAIIEKDIKTMATTFQSAAETVQDQAKTLFGDVNDRAKTALEKGSKAFEEFNDFSKGNVEALVESSKIAAKGAEDIAKYTTDYVKASVEKANGAAKQFAAVKSPTDFFKLQSDHAKEAMDAVMAETAKFTENYLKLLGEIAQPISNRVALAAEKMKIAA